MHSEKLFRKKAHSLSSKGLDIESCHSLSPERSTSPSTNKPETISTPIYWSDKQASKEGKLIDQ